MSLPEIKYCPGTLKEGFSTYSRNTLKQMFFGKKVSPILPYDAPHTSDESDEVFEENSKRMSISGVQEKFSILLEKNKLRLIQEGEQGQYILKPIPNAGKNSDQMPANEHLTMQIAKQVFKMETAENALIFFKNGAPAYITKRFDVKEDGSKWAQEDFASLAGRTPYTHGEHYKYLGNYSEMFELMQNYVAAYDVEAPKLFKLILFNYFFSNGDAHFKNFSLLETPLGDFRLSPAYDLLNSRIHVIDSDFALADGLLQKNEAKGKIKEQFILLGEKSGIPSKFITKIMTSFLDKEAKVLQLIEQSFLSEKIKRNYTQVFLTRLNKMNRI